MGESKFEAESEKNVSLSSPSAADMRHIAGVVKAARESFELTQRELATRIGVSAGLIGQIETGRSRPSVSTLLDIARVFGLSLDALFRPTDVGRIEVGRLSPPSMLDSNSLGAMAGLVEEVQDDSGESRLSHLAYVGHIEDHVVRSGARDEITLEGGVRWELLTPSVDRKLSFMVVTYPPGTASSMSSHLLRHDDNEYFYIIAGVLQVRLMFEEATLYGGDSMYFDSSRPHRFENRADTEATGIWVVAPKGPAGNR